MSLTEFLLARIAEDGAAASEEYRRVAGSPRRNGKAAARRMMLELEAKRRIVELHAGRHVCWIAGHDPDGEPGETMRDGDCDTLQALALPYADHSDFQESWRT